MENHRSDFNRLIGVNREAYMGACYLWYFASQNILYNKVDAYPSPVYRKLVFRLLAYVYQ